MAASPEAQIHTNSILVYMLQKCSIVPYMYICVVCLLGITIQDDWCVFHSTVFVMDYYWECTFT